MKKINFKKAGFVSSIIIIGVAFVVTFANIDEKSIAEPVEEEVFQQVYRWTPLGAEGDPGADASGWLGIYFINISTGDSGGYGYNNTADLFETWAQANMPGLSTFGNADEFEFETESEKTFVILSRHIFNRTHAWEGSNFNEDDCDVQITMTCTDWVVGANINNVSGTAYVSRNETDDNYIYINFVWDNSGSGYQIADDATWAIPEIYQEARF